ncbi:TPA: oxidoreductase [Escherichia coli]|nr:oxidoreductase [Escherichia coli]
MRLNNIQIFKNEQLIPLNENEIGEVVLSGRQLHEFLEIGTEYAKWFSRMKEYGFVENQDFAVIVKNDENPLGGRPSTDHVIKLDMAKEIAMIQRNEKGKQARQYFIKVEKAWNSPEMIMKRALEIANRNVQSLKLENEEHKKQIQEQKPKVLFAEAVTSSKTSILVGDLAKLIKQNGHNIGQKRLFQWLRDKGYLIKRKGSDWNMPTQRSMDQELFEIKESTHINGDGVNVTTKTPKVTGKGQVYFINKFINKEEI